MSCDNLGPPSQADFNQGGADLAKAMGVSTCSTYNKSIQNSFSTEASLSASASGSAGWGAGTFSGSVDSGFSATNSFVDSLSTAVGCENIAIAASQMANSTKKISCLLTKNTSAVTKTANNINRIIFRVKGGSLNAQNMTISQKIEFKMVDLTQISSTTKNEISDTVKSAALSAVDAVQTSKTGVGATPQGQKMCSDFKSKLSNESLTNIVNDTMNSVSVSVSNQNEIIFEVDGGDLNFNKDFIVNQDMIVDMMSTTILANAVSASLTSFTEQISSSTTKAKQKAENLGVDTLGRQAGDASAAIVKARMEGRQNAGISGIVFVIIMVLIFKFGGGSGGPPGSPGSQGMKMDSTTKIGGYVVCGIIILIGIIATWWSFVGYDKIYDQKVKAWYQMTEKCVADDMDPCPAGEFPKYSNPAWQKALSIIAILAGIGGIVFLYFKTTGDSSSETQSISSSPSSPYSSTSQSPESVSNIPPASSLTPPPTSTGITQSTPFTPPVIPTAGTNPPASSLTPPPTSIGITQSTPFTPPVIPTAGANPPAFSLAPPPTSTGTSQYTLSTPPVIPTAGANPPAFSLAPPVSTEINQATPSMTVPNPPPPVQPQLSGPVIQYPHSLSQYSLGGPQQLYGYPMANQPTQQKPY